jgi:hypothetical protein
MRQKYNYYQLIKNPSTPLSHQARGSNSLHWQNFHPHLFCVSQILALKHSVHCGSYSSHY